MQLALIENADFEMSDAYKIARVVYAETGAHDLRVVEALTSMISNAARRAGCTPTQIVRDETLFECINVKSPRHELLKVDASRKDFQMCVRVARRMLRGNLNDACWGAVRFHHADVIPKWAVARGYIADIGGLMFYLAGGDDE